MRKLALLPLSDRADRSLVSPADGAAIVLEIVSKRHFGSLTLLQWPPFWRFETASSQDGYIPQLSG
jgi:hypothetical protein